MRVLHVAQPTSAGLVECVRGPVDDQVRRGWEVCVASPVEGELRTVIEAAGGTHIAWEASRTPGAATPAETSRLRGIIAEVAPELVHLHSSKAGLCGRLVLRGRLPTVFQPQAWSFHAVGGFVGAAAAAWERIATRWTHALVCASRAERAEGEGAGIRAPWHVIYNGVDVERLQEADEDERRAARGRLGLPEGPLAVCVARLSRQKGQDVLLDAWPAVRERVPDAELALVGGGASRVQLEARRVAGVRFAGERSDVPDWLAGADVVVSASRWEGMSLAILEAMARGRSIVATDVAGSHEQLGGEAGVVVPPEDPDALAAEIVRRLADPELRAAEGLAARRRAVSSHDVRETSAQLAQLYGELMGEARTKVRVPAG
jgi:glycosyltransferase involved in cell wall biosynthesis